MLYVNSLELHKNPVGELLETSQFYKLEHMLGKVKPYAHMGFRYECFQTLRSFLSQRSESVLPSFSLVQFLIKK